MKVPMIITALGVVAAGFEQSAGGNDVCLPPLSGGTR